MAIDITYTSILRVIGVLVAIWIIYQVLDVLAIIFFGIIVAAALTPEINKLQKEGIPRLAGAILMYVLLALVFAFLVYIILPPTIQEVGKLSTELPPMLNESLHSLSLPQSFFDTLSQNLANISTGTFTWLLGLSGSLGSILFVVIISFYLTVEDQGIKRFLQNALPDKHPDYVLELIERSQSTLAQWLKAQIILMVIIGVMAFIAFSLIHIPNALALAAFAGLMEIIPIIGPIIGAVPAVIFGFNIAPSTGLLVIIVFTIIQQIESQILTPQIMKRAFEINPILILIAIFIGAKLGGVIGVLASVPLLALGIEFSKDYYGRLSGK